MLYILNLYSAICQLYFNKRRKKSSLMPDFKNLITNENKQHNNLPYELMTIIGLVNIRCLT